MSLKNKVTNFNQNIIQTSDGMKYKPRKNGKIELVVINIDDGHVREKIKVTPIIKPKTETTWRYGLMKYENGSLGVHEIHNETSWTADPIIVGDNLEEILETLEMIKKDIKNYPIKKWKKI